MGCAGSCAAGAGCGLEGSAAGLGAGPGVQYMRDTCGPWQVPLLPSISQGSPADLPMQICRAGSIGPTSARAAGTANIDITNANPELTANFEMDLPI